MRLSRKIEKLFSPDVLLSLWEHACRWTHPVDANKILAAIDRDELQRLRARYPERPNARKINAYENAAYWIEVNVRRVQDLWLDRSPPLRILDLGCGPGYFLHVAQLFGHSGIGLDTKNDPLFDGLTEFLGVQRTIARIEPQVPLPDLGEKFDLITAHRVCFHRLERTGPHQWREWAPLDWKFFIADVRSRFLEPNGRLYLEFNPRHDGSSPLTPEIRAAFKNEGARIFRFKVLFGADPKRRPQFKEVW